MRLFEYQGKLLFQNCGIKIPKSHLLHQANDLAGLDFGYPAVAKVQTLGPSRGEFGGVQVCPSLHDAENFVADHLNSDFRGEKVNSILIEELIHIRKEYYFALRINSLLLSIDLVFAPGGGNGIEARAKQDPNSIKVIHLDPCKPFFTYDANNIAKELGFSGELLLQFSQLIFAMHTCFTRYDAKLVEINPIAITDNGEVYALDAIVQLDDDANFRQDLGAEIGPITEERPRESTEREERALSIDKEDYRGAVHYIDLDKDGDIGLLSVGSGFSITVMDMLQNFGIKPANFCDCSGNPSKEKVAKAAKLILGIPNIKAFLFISGMVSQPLDVTAEGLIMAIKEMKPTIPIFVRMAGNQEEEAVKRMKAEAIQNVFSRWVSVEDVILKVKASLSAQESQP